VVGQRTLDPYAEVRILDPQPEATGTSCGLPIPAIPLSSPRVVDADYITFGKAKTDAMIESPQLRPPRHQNP
jgi:hypothetical protein